MKSIIKKVAVVLTVCAMLCTLGACANCTTVDGMTQGSASKSTQNGTASFDIKNYHVKMTNCEWDADPTGKVIAEMQDDNNLVRAEVDAYDGGNEIWQRVIDGQYPTTITSENVVDVFNRLFQIATSSIEVPITNDLIVQQSGVILGMVQLSDSEMYLFASENTNKYVVAIVATEEHNTTNILTSIFDALQTQPQ